ncbi:T9SS type A sorting domain-containing protein [bacterium]|nr:T9SS type A sorting domain-containing protein [bacterium]
MSEKYGYHRLPQLLVTSRIPLILAILIGLTVAEIGHATLYRVPSMYPSIQAAVDSAPGEPGDTVLVEPGRHVENVHIYGKELVLASEFVLNGDPATITATVIDGSAMNGADTASTVLWTDIPGTTSEIRGLTIIGGDGTNVNDSGALFREGGGLCVWSDNERDGYLSILDNVFRDNNVVSQGVNMPIGGGGMTIWWTDITMKRNVFYNNYADEYSGAFAMNKNVSTVQNNLFTSNHLGANTYGGTICYYWYATTAEPFSNNTIAGSSVASGSNRLFRSAQVATPVEFRNNIFNEASATVYSNAGGISPTFSYNLSYNLLTGEGNIAGVPFFDDYTFYVLSDASDGVDDGDPSILDMEDLNDPGQALWPAKGTTACDMGVYGGPGMPIGGFPDFTMELSIDDAPGSAAQPSAFTLSPAYPNPFNSSTSFNVILPQSAELTVRVFNLAGRQVSTIANGRIPAGTHEFSFDAYDLASGSYFIRAIVPGQMDEIRRVTLLR